MLNSGHDQPLANTCGAAVGAVSDCRQTRDTNVGRRVDRVLSPLYVYSLLYILNYFGMMYVKLLFCCHVICKSGTHYQFVSLSSGLNLNTGLIGFVLFLYIYIQYNNIYETIFLFTDFYLKLFLHCNPKRSYFSYFVLLKHNPL